MNNKFLIFIISMLLGMSCQRNPKINLGTGTRDTGARFAWEIIRLDSMPDQHLTELQPCDILVKPNLNILPGTTFVGNGDQFGHAVLVIRGGADTNESSLLAKTIIFESQATDVPAEYQLRQIAAYLPGEDYRFAFNSFSPGRLGNLYRLRMDLTHAQRESIISYVLGKDNDLSSYRAMKRFIPAAGSLSSPAKKPEYWYCSLLIWQAFYDVLGIDIDANQGVYVYPNDLINSPYFNDEPGRYEKRVRF
jgi:hypothetical protein